MVSKPTTDLPGHSGWITSHWIVKCGVCQRAEFCNGKEGALDLGYRKVKELGYVCKDCREKPNS